MVQKEQYNIDGTKFTCDFQKISKSQKIYL